MMVFLQRFTESLLSHLEVFMWWDIKTILAINLQVWTILLEDGGDPWVSTEEMEVDLNFFMNAEAFNLLQGKDVIKKKLKKTKRTPIA